MTNAEKDRLRDDYEAWCAWGPYVAERAWGTVREDYTANGDAWNGFTYDTARSRTFRWNEDGLFGFSDSDQRWCLSVSLWNGRDPHLKERLFGLNGHEGNHAEDAKEEWWHLDATPSHSWGQMAYAYPRMAFPYDELRSTNRSLSREDPEFELVDTGIFDDGWWDVVVTHAKASPEDLCVDVTVTNRSDVRDTIHLLPTIWFRNRWSWGRDDNPVPVLSAAPHGVSLEESDTGPLELSCTPGAQTLVCNNETNRPLVHDQDPSTPYPKDGINDHVIHGTPTVDPEGTGTKAALWYRFEVDPGEQVQVRLRLAHEVTDADDTDDVFDARKAEADEFYASILPADLSPERTAIGRQALAGLLFSKQWYHFDVAQWLEGDPASNPPPASRLTGRNFDWSHLNNADVIPMPDTWEYPWYAAWDTAFHCLPFTLVDPQLAKAQLVLLGREWYQHPNGQLPAYEWSFSDVNPPVHAWAALRVFEIDGGWDNDFLERVLHKLMINFTWWVNRRDIDGNNLFDGGFLGLDNIGPFDRSAGLGVGSLDQADATAWMAMYALDLLDISLRLTTRSPAYEDVATKFAEHFAYIATAMDECALWHDEDGFYYDVLRVDDDAIPVAVRSMVGLIPIFATRMVSAANQDRLSNFSTHLTWFRENKPEFSQHMFENDRGDVLMSLVSPERLVRILETILNEDEFLSPFGLRGLSKAHESNPFTMKVDGREFSVGYEPGESQSSLFGGNSNWRGPVWFPLNYLLIESLRRFDYWSGGSLQVEFPCGSEKFVSVGEVADMLGERLISLFETNDAGVRPSATRHRLYVGDGAFADRVQFFEYFHGDTGQGLGASHQTGWTALVASLLSGTSSPLGRRAQARARDD